MNKGLTKIFIALMAIAITVLCVYLIVGSKDNIFVISEYENVRPDSSSGFSKVLIFLDTYTKQTGDTSLAESLGVDVVAEEEEGEQVASVPSLSSDHNHYAIRQGDWDTSIYGGTIAGRGCGICSMIATIAYLGGVELTPPEFVAEFVDSSGNSLIKEKTWPKGSGMAPCAPGVFVDWLNSVKKYGQYELVASYTGSPGETSTKYILENYIKKYASSKDTVVMLSTSSGMFTNRGHIICCTDLSADGKSFHIADSSRKASGIVGVDWNSMSSYDFPLYDNNGNITAYHKGYMYNMKYAWAIRRTDYPTN